MSKICSGMSTQAEQRQICHGLPSEILVIIFQHTLLQRDEEHVPFSSTTTTLAIAASCRRFRQVTLSHRELWTQIHLHWPQPLIQLYLERAGPNDLLSIYHCAQIVLAEDYDSEEEESESSASNQGRQTLGSDVTFNEQSLTGWDNQSDEKEESSVLSLLPLSRVRRLQLDERKAQDSGHFLMLAQSALRQANTLSTLESFTLICDNFVNIHFPIGHIFARLQNLQLQQVVIGQNSPLLAPTLTSLILSGSIVSGAGTNAISILFTVVSSMQLLKHLDLSFGSLGTPPSLSDQVIDAEMHELKELAMKLEPDALVYFLTKLKFPTTTVLCCKLIGANRVMSTAPLTERKIAPVLRTHVARVLSAIRQRYQLALAPLANHFTTISVSSSGQYEGCTITLQNPVHPDPSVPHLPQQIILQLYDANAGPPYHVDVANLIAHIVPMLPSPESGYTTMVLGPVPWMSQEADWSSITKTGLRSVEFVEALGVAAEGLLAALQNDEDAFPSLSKVLARHLTPAVFEDRVRTLRQKRPKCKIAITSLTH